MALHFQRKDPLGTDQDVVDVSAVGVEIVDDEVSFRERFFQDRTSFLFRNGAALGLLIAFKILTRFGSVLGQDS